MTYETEKNEIQSHVDKENFHAAINLAISAMNHYRREENQDGVIVFLDVIQAILNTMKDKYIS